MTERAVQLAGRWDVAWIKSSDDRVPVGVLGWTLPSTMQAAVVHTVKQAMRLELTTKFDGDKVCVAGLLLTTNSGSVTPRDLSAVELGRVVYGLTKLGLDPAEPWASVDRSGRTIDEDELRLLASVYDVEHAAWGNPRQAVMDLWGMPRATANRWIRKAQSSAAAGNARGIDSKRPGPHV